MVFLSKLKNLTIIKIKLKKREERVLDIGVGGWGNTRFFIRKWSIRKLGL